MADSLVNELTQNKNAMSRAQLEADIEMINKALVPLGLTDISQFMKNIAAAESNLGADKLGGYSFSPFQIDPIRYTDIVQRATENPGSAASRRAEAINTLLAQELGRPDFNILNLDLSKEGHNPLIGAALTRMGLANIPEVIPQDLQGQAKYWKDYWNTRHPSAKGTEDKFMRQVKYHFPNLKDYSGGY